MEHLREVITKAGELIDFETKFVENRQIAGEPTKTGRFERIDYTTEAYEDGITYHKYCNVYLPWCYDAADKQRKYNVMYYQHGNTCDPELFTAEASKKTLDCLFEAEGIDPCIMVFITYYFDVTKDVETRKKTGMVPAGDNNYGGPMKVNYHKEVIDDIIPAVELKYNTYLTDASRDAIRASRDHRGFSGYSRGASCTWYMLHENFEYFRYYAPMSCMTVCGGDIHTIQPEETVIDYITGPIKAQAELPFFIYATNGHPHDVTRMTDQMKYLTKADVFSFGTDPGKNNLYFGISDFTHSDLYAPYYFYNSLKVLFH